MKSVFFILIVFSVVGCQYFGSGKQAENCCTSHLSRVAFQDTIDGEVTDLFVLKNNNGMSVSITNYGGRIVSLIVPGRDGKPTDVVVGMKSLKEYKNSTEPYFGALIGRVGNRIANGKFVLDGTEYSLDTNNGPNCLHGGYKGFQYVVWDVINVNDSTLLLSYSSKDGEQGLPGNLKVEVEYMITSANELTINYQGITDKATPVNLTNHAFFNLNGEGKGTILNHLLEIKASSFTPVDSTLIPTGEIASLDGTVFDFRKPTPIGQRIQQEDEQLAYGLGYDHNYALDKKENGAFSLAAKVIGDISGVVMEVHTTEPGLQFYSGNFMQSKNTFKSGVKDEFRTAFCLETQHFPNAVNQPNFPSIIKSPNTVFKSTSVYAFSVK